MSASLSVLAKVRDAMLVLGRSERAAVRKARLLSSASFSDFVRLTPQQNAKFGLSPILGTTPICGAQRRMMVGLLRG
jgi:hypothetical protein